MAVYIDDPAYPYRGMLMCHMLADTLEELHDMADRIGVHRHYFQEPRPGQISTPHYDICKSKRALAVRYGAVEVNWREMARISRRVREEWRRELRMHAQP